MNIKTFDAFLNSPGMQLPVRSTILKKEARVLVISPIGFSESQLQEIEAIGPVTDIIAPNRFHHLFIARLHKRFPQARLWCAAGLEKKRQDLPWHNVLTPESWMHGDLLEVLPMQGAPRLNEVEFFHKETKTLIASDLCFNLQRPSGWGNFVLRLMGNFDGFACSRFLNFLVKDKKAFQQFVEQLMRWDFERIIVGHGSIVEKDGKRLLQAALQERGLI